MTKILIIPKGYLGDIVLISPVLEALKLHERSPHITVLVPPQFAEYVSRDPLVDDVLVFDRRGEYGGWSGLRAFATVLSAKGFEKAYSFHASPRTGLLLRLAGVPERVGYLGGLGSYFYTRRVRKPMGFHEVIRNLELVRDDLTEDARDQVQTLKRSGPIPLSSRFSLRVPVLDNDDISESVYSFVNSGGSYVVLSPGSAWETKRWSARGFQEVARSLLAQGGRVVVVGAPQDTDTCDAVSVGLSGQGAAFSNMCGRTSLWDLIYLVKRAQGVICNDSLALHIASAAQVPTVVIFCATSPLFGFGPWKNRAIVVEKGDLFCKPCRRHGSRRCPTGTNACMEQVSSESVLEAFSDLISDKARRGGGNAIHVIPS